MTRHLGTVMCIWRDEKCNERSEMHYVATGPSLNELKQGFIGEFSGASVDSNPCISVAQQLLIEFAVGVSGHLFLGAFGGGHGGWCLSLPPPPVVTAYKYQL